MYRDYGRVYKVFIDFNKKVFNEDEVKAFVKEHFNEDEVVELDGYKLELLWEVPVNEGSHEIEIDLYYTLKDGEFGAYAYEYVS